MTEEPKANSWLIVLSIILSLIIVVLLLYIASMKGYIQIPFLSKTDTSTTNTDEKKTDDTTATASNTFTGKTVTATLPSGWSMKEYYDGQGSDYLVEGTVYKGLTAIKIFNASNSQMFYLEAVNGIGNEGCSEYYAFADDNPAFRSESQNIADEVGDPMHVNDFSTTPYTQFTWLGRTTRRISSKLYLDVTEGNNYFETSCFNVAVTLKGLQFTDKENNKYEAYFYGFSTTITNDELLKMDDILKSMKVI